MKIFKCQIIGEGGYLSIDDFEEALKLQPVHITGFLLGRLKPITGAVAALYNDFRLSSADDVSEFVKFARKMLDEYKDVPFSIEALRKWLQDRGYVSFGAAEVLRRAFASVEFVKYLNKPKEELLTLIKYWVYHGHFGYVNNSFEDLLNRAYAEGYKTLGDFLKAFDLVGLKDEQLTRDDEKH